MGMMSKLDNVQVGDEVAWCDSRNDNWYRTHVSRVTNLKIETDNGMEWSKRNGKLWGTGRDSWNNTFLYVMGDYEKKQVEKYETYRIKSSLVKIILEARWVELSIDDLDNIVTKIDQYGIRGAKKEG
jgi:hypothetical protein